MKRYIDDQGYNSTLLRTRLHRLAIDVVSLVAASGIPDQQSREPCQFAYPPKLLGLDILIDDDMKPWLLEIERGPDFLRLFDGHRERNPYLKHLMRMYVYPVLKPDEDDATFAADSGTDSHVEGRMEAIESERRHRLIPLHSVDRHDQPNGI